MKRNASGRRNAKAVMVTGMTLWMGSGPAAMANPFFKHLRLQMPDDMETTEAVGLTPFHGSFGEAFGGNEASGFALGGGTIGDTVRKALRNMSLDAAIETRAVQSTKAFGLRGVEENSLYRFYVKGVPFCDHEMRAVRQGEEPAAMIGSMPKLDMTYLLDADVAVSQEATLERVGRVAADFNVAGALKPLKWEKCWKVSVGELRAAWRVWVESGPTLYVAVANPDEVYAFTSQLMDIDGKASIYPNNKLDGKLEEFTVTNMAENGKLENDYFYVSVDPTSGKSPTEKADHVYAFPEGSDSFIQTSIFTNVNRSLAWYSELGYGKDNFGPIRLRVMAHAFFNGDNNNALYKPGVSEAAPPTIFVGDGNGRILQNLGTDRDVVSHEFGHHVVYQSIQEIQGESLVIHEGLADTFTFLKTGNSCLGESICPANSPIGCRKQSDGQLCLRSAENDFTYGSPTLPSEPHMKSQFLSGMVWDMRTKDGIDPGDLEKIVYGSISKMVRNSGYKDLVLAMLVTDLNLFNGSHCDKITERAKARGLAGVIGDVSCANGAAFLQSMIGTSSNNASSAGGGTTQSTTKRSKKKGNGFCGVVLGGGADGGLGLFVMLALPLLAARRRRD